MGIWKSKSQQCNFKWKMKNSSQYLQEENEKLFFIMYLQVENEKLKVNNVSSSGKFKIKSQ